MMKITLTPDLEHAIAEEARQQAMTPEEIVLSVLREKFLPVSIATGSGDTLSEWDQEIRAAAAQVEAVLARGQESHP